MGEFPKEKIAESAEVCYFRGSDPLERRDEYILVWIYDRHNVISVLPGKSYGVPKFHFAADDHTKKEIENLLIAALGEEYQKRPLRWTIGDRD